MHTFVNDKNVKFIVEFEGDEKKYYGLKLKEHESLDLEKEFKTLTDKEFLAKYRLIKGDIIALGDPSDPPTGLIDLLFPPTFVRPLNSLSYKDSKTVKSYKCCGCKDNNKINFVIIHEDKHSAWNCLLEHFNYPEHLVIFKR
jgi:hypothetical protein